MAQIIENSKGRRSVRLSVDDVISVVQEYQNIVKCEKNCETVRRMLTKSEFYLPEEVY